MCRSCRYTEKAISDTNRSGRGIWTFRRNRACMRGRLFKRRREIPYLSCERDGIYGHKEPNSGFYHVLHNPEVNPAISRSEMPDDEVWEVRQVHSNDETPVMGADVKEPDFCERFSNSSWLSGLPERKREGIEHER